MVLCAGCSDDDVLPPSPLPDFEPELLVEELWTEQVGDGLDDNFLTLIPAVTERFVYAVSHDGELIKLDRTNGDELWEVDLEEPITGGVGAGYGVVVIGSANGEAIALNEADGKEIWRVSVGAQILASPAVAANRVIVQAMDGRLLGLNRETGKVEWVHDSVVRVLTLRGSSHPVILGNITLAGFANGKLVALDTETGYVGWEKAVSQPSGRSELERLNDLDGRFWVTRDVVYAATYQGKIASIDIPSGQVLWTKPMSSYAGVAEFLGHTYVVDDQSNLIALDSVNGAQEWQQAALRGRRLSGPAAYDRFVVVGDFEGYLHWLSYKDGKFLARVKVDGDGVWAAPVVKGDVVYVQGNSGELAAYKVVKPVN